MPGWSPFALTDIARGFWTFPTAGQVSGLMRASHRRKNFVAFALPPTVAAVPLATCSPSSAILGVSLVIIGLLSLFAALFFQQSFSVGDRIERARNESKPNSAYVDALEQLLKIANYASMVCVVGVVLDAVPLIFKGDAGRIGLFVACWLTVHMILLALAQVSYMHKLATVVLRGVTRG